MLIRQHERFVEELNVQMSFKQPTTSSGAIMTLPAATADLRDWVADQREFSSVQRDDWMQVIDDFRDSLAETGPKLSRHVEAVTSQIESQLPKLISPSAPDPVPSPIASLLRKIAPSGLSDRVAARIESLVRRLLPARTDDSTRTVLLDRWFGAVGHLTTPPTARRGIGNHGCDYRGLARFGVVCREGWAQSGGGVLSTRHAICDRET